MSRAGLDPADKSAVLRLLREGSKPKAEIARITGVHRATIFRMLQREPDLARRN